jgi:hypothetical protein
MVSPYVCTIFIKFLTIMLALVGLYMDDVKMLSL